MGFLRIGLFLLLIFRLFYFGQRWRGRMGKPVTVGSESVRVHITRSRDKEVRGVRLTLEVADQFKFTLRAERWLDRFAKRIGIAQEWQTGDELFDERVFILSGDPALLEPLSLDAGFRNLIRRVLDFHGRAWIECARGKLIYGATLSKVDRKQSDEQLRERFANEIQPALTKFRDRLERISAGPWQADRDPALRRKGWLVGLCTALCVPGIVGFIVGLAYERHQVVREAILHDSAWITSGLVVALILAAFLLLRRSPHTHAVLLDVLLAAMPSAWLASSAGLTWYNQKYDASAPTHAAVSVESLYTSRHRSSTSYHLVVSRWPDARGEREVTVREDEYSLMQAGRCIGVIWHSGRLGDGWISGYESARTDNCGSYSDEVEAE